MGSRHLLTIALVLPAIVPLWDRVPGDGCDRPPSPSTDRKADRPTDGPGSAPDGTKLSMTRAIACRSIDGYERYEPLGDAPLTSDEKLLVYFRPGGYKVARRGKDYVVHFSQDGRIRRRGKSTPLRTKLKLLDIESATPEPPGPLYLRNTVSLKDLPPGDYEFDIILRDENAPGRSATQTIPFRVVRATDFPGKSRERPAPEPEGPRGQGISPRLNDPGDRAIP